MSTPRWPQGYQRPAIPKVPALPSDRGVNTLPPFADLTLSGEVQRDEQGFPRAFTRTMSSYGRLCLRVAYDDLRLNKDLPPGQQGLIDAGTLPELVFYGGLRLRGWSLGYHPQGFAFQKNFLGGRTPGGSVADFVLYGASTRRGAMVAVYVDSFYHALSSPFAGGAKRMRDKLLFERVRGFERIGAVVIVNKAEWGYPLQNGPDYLIRREITEAIRA